MIKNPKLRHVSFFLVTAALVLISLHATGQQAPSRVIALPGEFAAYRTWKPLLDKPEVVPVDLWIRCIRPTQADLDAARKQYGPHTEKMIQVYANPAAQKTLKNGKNKPFPVGSILAKEKLEGQGSQAVFSGIAFMIKRSPDQFPETGGWEYRYFPSSENERAQIQTDCASCHKTASAKDYVFGEYGKK